MSEFQVFPAVAVAFVVTAVLMAAIRPAAASIGLVDRPGGRKRHQGDVPIIGGIAMFFGLFAGLVLIPTPGYSLLPLFVASALLLVIGVLDDRYHLPAIVRLSAQIGAVLVMFFGANLHLSGIGDPFGTGEIVMGRFTLIFTALVAVTMINAYNLIDGIDGLAGSLAFVALLAVSAAAGIGHAGAAIALVALAAIAGFLIFNFPASWNRHTLAFMGDAGSTLLGFTIVWVTLGVSQGPEREISPVLCLWFASIPIYDTLTCFVRRALKGKSPFAPGRDHFHHTLKRGGFGVRQTVGMLTGLQLVYATIALAAHYSGMPDWVMFASWSVLGVTQLTIIRFIARHRRAFGIRRRRT